MDGRRHARGMVLWATLGVSLSLIALTILALQLTEAPAPPVGSGLSFPRMRGPVGPLEPGAVLRSMGVGTITWYMSLAAAPGFVLLSQRLRFDRGRWAVSLAVVTAVILVLVLLTALVQYRISYGDSPMAPDLVVFLRGALLTGTVPFLAVAGFALALDAWTRAHQRELEAARMRGQLAEARLEALTAQLQPHFLFNTLQGISTLIRRDPEKADRMLARLSDLLRDVLMRHDRREVSLEEELEVLAPYLDIAGWRFGDRLTVHVDVAEEARSGLVPFFLLQPLVENALHHGAGSRAGPATVRIGAARAGDRLRLSVTDDGGGAHPDAPGTGIGLGNTRTRLEEMFGAAHELAHGPDADGGFTVRLEIPWRPAAPAPASGPSPESAP